MRFVNVFIEPGDLDVRLPRPRTESSITWSAPLPGYALDSGATGEREADISGYVVAGEVEDFEAHDVWTRLPVELPSRVQDRAELELIEAAARMP